MAPVPDVIDFVLIENAEVHGLATNAAALLQWFAEVEGSVAGRNFVICGVGPSGSELARLLRDPTAST